MRSVFLYVMFLLYTNRTLSSLYICCEAFVGLFWSVTTLFFSDSRGKISRIRNRSSVLYRLLVLVSLIHSVMVICLSEGSWRIKYPVPFLLLQFDISCLSVCCNWGPTEHVTVFLVLQQCVYNGVIYLWYDVVVRCTYITIE